MCIFQVQQQQQQAQQQQHQQQPGQPQVPPQQQQQQPGGPPGGPGFGPGGPSAGPGASLQQQQQQNAPTPQQTMSNTVQADKSESSNPTTGTKSGYLIRLLLELEIRIRLSNWTFLKNHVWTLISTKLNTTYLHRYFQIMRLNFTTKAELLQLKLIHLFASEFLLLKKLEIGKTKPTIIISV